MNPERWDRIKEILVNAEKLPAGDRARYLSVACDGDPELLDEVSALSNANVEKVGFLDRTLFNPGNNYSKSNPLSPGGRVGPYTLIRELGRGGMGSVYLAVRADGEFERIAAVKVLNRGMDSDKIVERFRNERQILANLNHPHIARLFEGATTEDGLPYLVMEYIRGEPIHRYCANHKLPINARLGLFQKVCSAVHFAHQNLIIHRDLKPGNILVTPKGEPKLLDFGIAKLLAPQINGSLTGPATALGLMTPEYASPEQVRGETLTTASDVYSLGVLLYELLTGRRPYLLKEGAVEDLRLAVCEQEPEKPSICANHQAKPFKGNHGVLGLAQVWPATRKVGRELKGDLDNIILKALRKEAHRRYTSVEAFSDDIDRYLKGFPVLAQKETFGYLTLKFLNRHRLGTAMATLLMLAVVGFMGLLTIHQHDLEREQERTRVQMLKAEQTSKFLIDLFKYADPYDELDRGDLTVSSLLDFAANDLQKGSQTMVEMPETKASLMDVLANIFNHLTLYDRAKPLLEQALALRRKTFGETHGDIAKSLLSLGRYHQARGNISQAKAYIRDALEMQRRVFGKNHPEVAETLIEMAHMAGADQWEPLYKEALDIAEHAHGSRHPFVARILVEGARLARDNGHLDRSVTFLQRALEIQDQTLGSAHPESGLTLDLMGSSSAMMGKFSEAERYFLRALEIKEKGLYPDHPFIPSTLNNLGHLYRQMGHFEKAESYYHRSLALCEKLFGARNAAVSIPMTNLGALYLVQGKYNQAELLLREQYSIKLQVGSPDHRLVTHLHNLGVACLQQSREEDAETFLRRSLEMRTELVGPKHINLAPTLSSLGRLYWQMGDMIEAERMQQRALEIVEKRLGPNHIPAAKILCALAEIRQKQFKYEEAEALLECTIQIQEKSLGLSHPDLALTHHVMAQVTYACGQEEKAEKLYLKALAIREKAFGANHPDIADSLHDLASLHLARGEALQAEAYCKRTIEIRRRMLRPGHPEIAEALDLYAATLAFMNRKKEAADMEALAMKTRMELMLQ